MIKKITSSSSDATLCCRNCNAFFVCDALEDTLRKEVFAAMSFGLAPAPSLCPRCRYLRRLSHRNERNLYNRKCDATGKQIVSLYPRASPYVVYDQQYWWGGEWDPLSYGCDFVPSESFFEQFSKLKYEVPRVCITNPNCQNAAYTNQGSHNKDCYLIVASNHNERCFYGSWFQKCRDCFDCYMIEFSNDCYECVYGSRLTRACYSFDCHKSSDVWFSSDCVECEHIFGCSGLRGVRYALFNKQVSVAAYRAFMNTLHLSHDAVETFRKRAEEVTHAVAHKFYCGHSNYDFSGDYLVNCQSTHDSFNCRHATRLVHAQDAWYAISGFDQTEVLTTALCGELEGGAHLNHCFAVSKSWNLSDSLYSELCFDSNHLFGCIGLRNREYCIFNRQFTRATYEKTVKEIVAAMVKAGEWGEFFPSQTSAFAYNESIAQDYQPLGRRTAERFGSRWSVNQGSLQKYFGPRNEVPASILDCMDSLPSTILTCSETGQTYRILKEEFQFLRRMGLPPPRTCPEQRRRFRSSASGGRTLVKAQCNRPGCGEAIMTALSQRSQNSALYCEECYERIRRVG